MERIIERDPNLMNHLKQEAKAAFRNRSKGCTGPGVHTPYQSLAPAMQAPGSPQKLCPQQPYKCTGMA